MQFIDYVTIKASSGHGGAGAVSFRREKYVPKGGPDGGDGGKGGDLVFVTDRRLNTLLDLRYKRVYHAEKGKQGMGKHRHGRDGADTVIPVPVGTVIKDLHTGEVIADLDSEGASFIAARGGIGGKGNAHFTTSTHQAPRFAQPGMDGEHLELIIELKLLADVGLIGLPNAGKSTLISAISAARPKIADYPFTTLIPNLGVVKPEDFRSFVVADIPGLIEGAHRGAGLGFQFLRHVERTSILLHLVDISEMSEIEPVEAFETVEKELGLYSPELPKKPRAVAATKIDIKGDGKRLDMLKKYCKTKGMDFFAISAASNKGLKELTKYLARKVSG